MALPWGAPLTEDYLAAMPEDGHRYELLDGARRPGYEVLAAPFDVRLSRVTVLEPDVLVARQADLTPARLEAPPVLAVEVLSPSTRRIDLGSKRLAYEAAGVPAYWLVDPDVPDLTVLESEAGRYVERATVTGDEAFHATAPFPVAVGPARLLDD